MLKSMFRTIRGCVRSLMFGLYCGVVAGAKMLNCPIWVMILIGIITLPINIIIALVDGIFFKSALGKEIVNDAIEVIEEKA